MRKKEAKTSNGDKKPREPKSGATAKTAEKSKTSTKPRTKPSAKPLSKPKPATKPADKPSPKPKPAVKPSSKPKNQLYPAGTESRCTVYYSIQYVGKKELVKGEKSFAKPCRLVFNDPIFDLQLSIVAARHARTELWQDWVRFSKNLELRPPVNAPGKIDGIFIINTEYYTDKTKDRKLTTKFMDGFIRSISGYSEIPGNF
ncbi:MAG TPA: hypothetical protein PLR50_04315 [Candidatus Rifleibacterium sp.]|nr:hypothetical protein [Candidatus Rifleibacterium sp.]